MQYIKETPIFKAFVSTMQTEDTISIRFEHTVQIFLTFAYILPDTCLKFNFLDSEAITTIYF